MPDGPLDEQAPSFTPLLKVLRSTEANAAGYSCMASMNDTHLRLQIYIWPQDKAPHSLVSGNCVSIELKVYGVELVAVESSSYHVLLSCPDRSRHVFIL